ncbi:MAG: metalloregulator ArsR/SmtB family transcription factor [Candidatus Bathyarchaeia archaeon]
MGLKANIFAALSDVSRLRILALLAEGEKCVCEITPALGLAQPTVSRHLSVLAGQGLLKSRKEGKRMLYSVAAPEIYKVLESVDGSLINRLKENIVARMVEA